MKTAIVSIIVLALNVHAIAQTPGGLATSSGLPKTWTKDFRIKYTFGGSMDGSRADLTITYDSCIYIRNSGMKAPVKTVFLMTEKNRADILKKMTDLKIDKVKSEMSQAPVHDGWSSMLCVGTHCINGGTRAEMSDQDDQAYDTAHAYLEQFAASKGKI
jgi:hypothetical protein